MAMMATSSDMMPESWLTPTQLHHNALPDDIWSKFDIEHDKALVFSNPEAMTDSSSIPYNPLMNFMPHHHHTTSISNSTSPHYHMGVPPTPPHSPPTEHDLDDLVASIPEILESPSATPPSDISDILSDLESTPLADNSMEVSWGSNSGWWAQLPVPAPEESLKRDIMWGGGTCCPSLLEVPRKERQVSECSADAALRDALRPEEISEDEDSEDNMPDTPSGTDSDCDVDDQSSVSFSSDVSSPRSTNSASRYSNIVVFGSNAVNNNNNTTIVSAPFVNNEHNYCGRVPEVPEPEGPVIPGIVTPSDTEDEVDVVSCNDQTDVMVPNPFSINTGCPTTPTVTAPTSSGRQQDPSKISADVKRQLQLRIHAMRNKQNRGGAGGGPVTPEAEEPTNSRFVSVKIKTQGKPAAYTKRMRDYHTEVMKTSKHRRRSRGESDEGRRSVHNSLERQRRVDLRNAFEYLRLLVPETKVLEKAPKVQILKKAALHCKQLHVTEQRLLREKEKLRKQLEHLQQRRLHSSS